MTTVSSQGSPSIWRGLVDGFRLLCPVCRKGRLYEGFRKRLDHCPECGVRFERPEEGDFLVSVVLAYSLTAVLVCALVFILNFSFEAVPLWTQLVVTGIFSTTFLLIFYRNLRGVAIAAIFLAFRFRDRRSG